MITGWRMVLSTICARHRPLPVCRRGVRRSCGLPAVAGVAARRRRRCSAAMTLAGSVAVRIALPRLGGGCRRVAVEIPAEMLARLPQAALGAVERQHVLVVGDDDSRRSRRRRGRRRRRAGSGRRDRAGSPRRAIVRRGRSSPRRRRMREDRGARRPASRHRHWRRPGSRRPRLTRAIARQSALP